MIAVEFMKLKIPVLYWSENIEPSDLHNINVIIDLAVWLCENNFICQV